jgi:hypothetical protein
MAAADARTGAEFQRLNEARDARVLWRKWGPYLSERQWGTVREDYSESGDAWNHFSHDQARSRAYRWGEDGLAGISDDRQLLCFALALWNGRDPIIKERLFGLTNSEGNHGEDVKEYYFYLDSTPTHSYMKYLYKYPQSAYSYDEIVKFQEDPHWRDLLLFYEYFHGDDGAGLGVSYQTGWTGIVARTMHFFATTTAGQVIEAGKAAVGAAERRKTPARARVPAADRPRTPSVAG